MILCLRALENLLAKAALQLNFRALFHPVIPQGIYIGKCSSRVPAAKVARDGAPALLPVVVPLLISKLLVALIAVELCRVQTLHHESVHGLAEVELRAAVGARVLFLLPLLNAGAAGELVALEALFGVFYYHEADRARKVLVHLLDCLVRREMPVCWNVCLSLAHELLQV